MSKIDDLADRVERLLLRHDELKRTTALLEQQLDGMARERDNLRSRLNAARSRIDVLLQRLPREPIDGDGAPIDVASIDANTGAPLRSIG